MIGEKRQTVPNGPHGWIQWKGTNVCMDVRCACGANTHVDEDFAYYVRCGACKRVYMVNPHVEIVELTAEEAVELAKEGSLEPRLATLAWYDEEPKGGNE